LELERFAIGVSVLCPGPVATSIIQTTLAFPGRPRIALTPEEIQMSDRTIAQLSPILPKA
jgi:short-subunit dehydrogenase